MNKRDLKKQKRKQKTPKAESAPKPEKMLKDLKIIDILKMPEYGERLAKYLEKLKQTREKVENPKPHPIDRLIKRRVWNADAMTGLYILVLNKQLDGYSSDERQFINEVCFVPYAGVIEQMQANEKERNQGGGAN